jgi:hypothetical protein
MKADVTPMTTQKLPLVLLLMMVIVSTASFLPVHEVQAAMIIYSDTENGVVSNVGAVGNGNIVAGDDGGDHYYRGFVKFSLSEVSDTLISATLSLYVYSGSHDGVYTATSPLLNPGLGDCQVFHIADYGTLDPTDFNPTLLGNHPGVLISSTTTPDVGYVSIDITAAVQDDARNGRAFSAYMIRNTVDTDSDGKVDSFSFEPIVGKPTDRSPFVSLKYGTVGGIIVPTDKLEVVAPFAALAGLITAVSAVIVVKRRRD